MEPLWMIWALVLCLFCLFFVINALRLYRKFKRYNSDAKAKDVYIITYDEKPSEVKELSVMDKNLMAETTGRVGKKTSGEKRRYPRLGYECNVEFIKQGKLFKATSKDLSYTGIFLTSKTPEKYELNEFITLTFQTPNGKPQKRSGKVVRKDGSGIGIRFARLS